MQEVGSGLVVDFVRYRNWRVAAAKNYAAAQTLDEQRKGALERYAIELLVRAATLARGDDETLADSVPLGLRR